MEVINLRGIIYLLRKASLVEEGASVSAATVTPAVLCDVDVIDLENKLQAIGPFFMIIVRADDEA